MEQTNIIKSFARRESACFVSDDKHFEDQTLKLPTAFLEDLKVCVKIHLF